LINRKNQNSVFFLTTLGVLFFVAGAFAQPPEDKTEQDKQGVYINKRPMRDFADLAVNQIESGKVNLEAQFRVVVSGKLASNNEGKHIVLADAKIEPVTQPENSDPGMVKLVQDGIMAVSDAGYFTYFDRLRVKNIVVTVEQTGDTFSVEIRADQPSEANARTAASGLGAFITAGKATVKGEEQFMMLSATSVSSEGNNIIINFKLPKAQFQELIKHKIAESKTANSKVSGD
jgi:hypothetical protein